MFSKKHLLPCLLFFAAAQGLQGQRLSLGFCLGAVRSTQPFSNPSPFPVSGWEDYKTGFAAAANLTLHLNEHLGVRGELGFERKGSQAVLFFTDQNGNVFGEDSFQEHFDYLLLPLLFELSFGKKVKGSAYAGQAFGYLVERSLAVPKAFPFPVQNETDRFRRFDHLVVAGLGGGFPVGEKIILQLQARVSYGLTNLRKDDPGELRNLSFTATAGLQFPLN